MLSSWTSGLWTVTQVQSSKFGKTEDTQTYVLQYSYTVLTVSTNRQQSLTKCNEIIFKILSHAMTQLITPGASAVFLTQQRNPRSTHPHYRKNHIRIEKNRKNIALMWISHRSGAFYLIRKTIAFGIDDAWNRSHDFSTYNKHSTFPWFFRLFPKIPKGKPKPDWKPPKMFLHTSGVLIGTASGRTNSL